MGLIPSTFTAGDTFACTIPAGDYPASEGWALTWVAVLPGTATPPSPITVTSTAQGSDHVLSVDAATTKGWAPGTWRWQLRAVKGLLTHTVGESQLVIRPDFTSGADVRTHAEKCLDAITACIEGRVDDPVAQYRIGDREARRIPMADLLKLRSYYSACVRRERGQPLFGRIPTEFHKGPMFVPDPGAIDVPYV